MTWSDLIDRNLIKTHKSNSEEFKNFRDLVDRDLMDASIEQLSIDRRYATAYAAALNLARFAVAAAGYRILARAGHHITSFEAAQLALGKPSEQFISYFDVCRRKRIKVDYDLAQVANPTELAELLEQVTYFNDLVEKYVATKSR